VNSLRDPVAMDRPAVARAAWLPPLWLIWLVVCAFLTATGWAALRTFTTQDPDDYMRLLQVRDWVAGQPWYDTRQYRFDPPHGAAMHWVRLVDLPIAFFLVLFKQFVAERPAELAAMTAVPLLQLLLAMRLLGAVVRQLGGSRGAALAAAALVPAFPLLLTNFVPTRIDHHGWQALAALAVAWCLLKDTWRHALLAGLIAAAWLLISLEGMALCATFGALFALRYWLWGQRQHEAYLTGLAVGLPVLFVIFRPLPELAQAMCDMPSWPHMLAFAGAAAVAGVARVMPWQDRPWGRLAALVPVGGVAAAALFVPLGWCVVSPLALDPYLKTHWFDKMAESAPLTRQAVSVATMTLWTLGLAVGGGVFAVRTAQADADRKARAMLAAVAVAACGFSLLIMRAGLAAQLLTLPLCALMINRLWARAQGFRTAGARVLATFLLLGLATPMLASALTKRLDRSSAMTVTPLPTGYVGRPCDFERLNALPVSHMFVTLDRGPELLARTGHSAVMSGYHRNQAKIMEVIKGFAAPLPESERIIRANHADYVVACTSSPDLWAAADAGPDNLADRIIAGKVPGWLQPVPGFTDSLRVYRVR
jgi:hypothetical protein